MGRLIALILALGLGALLAASQERLPSPRPADAPAAEFSADRAMADVQSIARAPHPLGSAENKRVRDHVARRMAQLGLSPQVRTVVAVQPPKWQRNAVVGGVVENVVGVLPGRDRAAPAYDSVPNSPGAADDAAGAAAALEIVRAIRARGIPARDVIVLITDGEEVGLLGAAAFFKDDPLARRIGLVINMEARGSSGRAQMFQTSPRNGGLVRLLQQGGVRPASSSLTVFVYERMPNDSDLTETLEAGVPGLNYAFIGRQFDYHSPTSTPALLDRGSLQDLGQEVLGVAAKAAFAPALPAPAESAVYGTTFEGRILAYPGWAGWLILLASAALLWVGVRRARRLEPFPWTDAARGAGALLFAASGAVAMLQFARRATGAGAGYMEQRFLLAQADRWEWAVGLIGFGFLLLAAAELARGRRIVALAPLVAGLGASAFGGFDRIGLVAGLVAAVAGVLALGRPVSRPGAWTGVLVLGLLITAAVQGLAPPAAYVFAWPLLLATAAAAIAACGAQRGYVCLVTIGLTATLALGFIGGLAHGVYQAMDLMPLLVLPIIPAALVIWPLAQPADGAPPGRWIGALMVVAGLALTAWVRFADPYDARHPEATHLVYHLDQDAGRAWRVSATPELPAWSRAVLESGGAQVRKLRHWIWSGPVDAAPAPMFAAEGPTVALLREPNGALRLRASPPPGERMLSLRLTPSVAAEVTQVGGAELRIALAAGETARVRWEGEDGVDVVLRPTARGRLEVKWLARLDRWPEPLPARPADVMPFNDSDTTYLTGTRRFTW
jgi:hypothetical protein